MEPDCGSPGGAVLRRSDVGVPPNVAAMRLGQQPPYRGEALLRRIGGTGYSVHVLDISPEGCKVELVETPRIGEHLLIKFDGLEALDVEVCWVEGPIGGLKFEKSFHPAVYEQLLKRLR
jgi:PilZ domain